MLVLVFTQFGIRRWLGFGKNMTVGQFLIFVLFELLILSFVNYNLFGEVDRSMFKEFLSVMRHTFLVLVIPYSMALLLLAFWSIRAKVQATQNELIKVGKEPPQQIHLKDENGKVVFSVKPENIILFKSEGNYIAVYFLADNQAQRKLIRNNLKKIENQTSSEQFLRVHRSYMVNLKHINSVDRSKRSYRLTLNGLPELPVAVSSNIKPIFEERLGIFG